MTTYEQHLAHQSRELYEFNIDEMCPCVDCERERFSARLMSVLLVIGVVLLVAGWWVS